jgi:hypothetical protein
MLPQIITCDNNSATMAMVLGFCLKIFPNFWDGAFWQAMT